MRTDTIGLPPSKETPAVYFLGSFPTIVEIRRDLPMVSPSGMMVRKIYTAPPTKSHLPLTSRATIYLNNIVRCCPTDKPKPEDYKACSFYTKEELRQLDEFHDQFFVVALGAPAIRAILGMEFKKAIRTNPHEIAL